MTGKKITVLICDDSAFIRQMFTEMLSAEPDIEVLDTASDPYDARAKIKALNPDVLTLDIEMPNMDGLTFLEKIMTLRPMPVVMASSLTQKGADEAIRALELGAVDCIGKPVSNQNRETIGSLRAELAAKIRTAAAAAVRGGRQPSSAPKPLSYRPADAQCLIAIGASTGGVEALREVFLKLPANSPPIVIAQHMPEYFTPSFAARLDSLSAVKVREAQHHMRVFPGEACLAPGNAHLTIVRLGGEYVCKLDQSPLVNGHRPSVDVLFRSVADAAGGHAVGVILTGMGKDGAEGLLRMRGKGAHTIGQNQASCVVYGMPQAAMKLAAVCEELPLSEIPGKMLNACEKGTGYASRVHHAS
ncbi:MAG: chemotaxis response regulator protein-glutamate methylesterase [Alphaproteobacteria bacterium]|nr:chemotaxis response regulator protein-glutamate methylesterase [Alphaproteobacteria bacterium]